MNGDDFLLFAHGLRSADTPPSHQNTSKCCRVKHLCWQKYLHDSKNIAVLYSELNTINLMKASKLQSGGQASLQTVKNYSNTQGQTVLKGLLPEQFTLSLIAQNCRYCSC